jgi:hypothetical protein
MKEERWDENRKKGCEVRESRFQNYGVRGDFHMPGMPGHSLSTDGTFHRPLTSTFTSSSAGVLLGVAVVSSLAGCFPSLSHELRL